MNARLEHGKEVYAKRGQELHKLLVTEWQKFTSTYPSELAGWRWKWSTSRSRFGSCHYGDKMIRISNRALLDPDYSKAIETLRHEVAHALAGQGAKHGPVWKEWAVRCGATPRSCGTGSEDAEAVPHRWELVLDHPDGSVEVFRRYQARPNRQFRIKLPTLSIVRRPETLGKLRLRWWSEGQTTETANTVGDEDD